MPGIGLRGARVTREVHDRDQGEHPTADGRRSVELTLLGGRLRGRIEIRDHARPERGEYPRGHVLPQQQTFYDGLEVPQPLVIGLGDDVVKHVPDRRQIDVHRGEGQGRPRDATELRPEWPCVARPVAEPAIHSGRIKPSTACTTIASGRQTSAAPANSTAATWRSIRAWTRASTALSGAAPWPATARWPGDPDTVGRGPAPGVVDGPPRISGDHPDRERRSHRPGFRPFGRSRPGSSPRSWRTRRSRRDR